jgi:mannose-6-phosphate isomerase-like protein (cupin superfamily)
MQHVTGASAPVHDWRGIAIRELTPPGAGLSGSLVEVDVPAGVVHPAARSTKCGTFYYCGHGELGFEVGGRRFLVAPGDVVIIDPGEWYSYRNDSATPARLLSFNVPAYDPAATEVREPGHE